MNTEILKICLEKGVLLDKDTYALFSQFEEQEFRSILEKILFLKERIITKSFLERNAEKISELVNNKKLVEKIKINLGLSLEISRELHIEKEEKTIIEKELDLGNLKVIYSLANLEKKLEPADFVRHYRNRYHEIKSMLLGRKELDNLISINKISDEKQNFSIIGIVYEKRVTKNKNILMQIEDPSGKITVLFSKNKEEIYEKAKDIIQDDIIALKGSGNREIMYVNDFFYPDAYLPEKIHLDRDESVAFISDMHVGSTNFFENNFERFIQWINGEVGEQKHRDEAKKVKYLLIVGDTIDGVGIFPGQETLLNIKDIRKQYEKLAFYLGKIRKDIKIIMCPGQHDSVRVAEPQPFIGKDYGESLYSMDNLTLVSNPAVIEIKNSLGKKGIKILMYHGASMNSFASEIESLRKIKAHDTPSKVVKELLKRRHLASIHSSVVYIPTEKEDPLVIKEAPDVITTADFHKPDIDLYNNILIVCNSCWQSITPFEEKMGNHPDPCKVPVLNLKTREIKILDFSDEPEDKVCVEKEDNVECVGK